MFIVVICYLNCWRLELEIGATYYVRAPGGEPVAPCKILPKIVFVFGIYDNIIKDYNNKDKI